MDFEAITTQIAQTVQKEANINAIFGEPKKLDEHTIMPVARIKITLGAGGGGANGAAPTAAREGQVKAEEGGENGASMSGKKGKKGKKGRAALGGGIEIELQPLGFVRDANDGAEFVAIEPMPDGLIGKVEHLIRGIRGPGPKVAEKRD